MKIQAIVTDIEGTTSSIDFVHRVLFPYSKKALPEYVRAFALQPEIADIILQVKQEIGQPGTSVECVIDTLLNWIEEDKKITALKTLQGFLWEHGFKSGEFKGHLYPDAAQNLKQWYELGIKLYVFSSGSVKAQKLLFGYSEYGDLTSIFSGYFDTKIGNKKEIKSYQNIAKAIAIAPDNILFLSDVVAELDAALIAGYNTYLLARDAVASNSNNHQVVNNFDQIKLDF
jgi:enolase-phosphatase E1